MNVEKNASAAAGSIVVGEPSAHERTHLRYTSDSYQKILDYHVGEILLTTIIFGLILLHHLAH